MISKKGAKFVGIKIARAPTIPAPRKDLNIYFDEIMINIPYLFISQSEVPALIPGKEELKQIFTCIPFYK